MPWSRALLEPITLDDGRTFTTLPDAADFMLQLPALPQANAHWQYAAEAMAQAAEPASSKTELGTAESRLRAALRAEGLLGIRREDGSSRRPLRPWARR